MVIRHVLFSRVLIKQSLVSLTTYECFDFRAKIFCRIGNMASLECPLKLFCGLFTFFHFPLLRWVHCIANPLLFRMNCNVMCSIRIHTIWIRPRTFYPRLWHFYLHFRFLVCFGIKNWSKSGKFMILVDGRKRSNILPQTNVKQKNLMFVVARWVWLSPLTMYIIWWSNFNNFQSCQM